ncbi:MAG: hypothetical protein HYU86_08340 [Chloroflexi bacterium]|nr:hypothetical protein [Chloroflexota bacterium]
MPKPDLRAKLRLGLIVFVGLMAVEVIEYIVGTTISGALPYLVILTVPGAGLILYYYMHIEQIRHTGGE